MNHLAYNRQFEPEIRLDAEGYITDQRAEPFGKMRYGAASMDGVGCELIAIYNALKKLSLPASLPEIAAFYEQHPGIWRNGKWGTKFTRIGDYFRTVPGVKGKRIPAGAYRHLADQSDALLTDGNVLLFSVINPGRGWILNGIHTFAAVRQADGKVRFLNAYKNADSVRFATTGAFFRDQKIKTILSVYLAERTE